MIFLAAPVAVNSAYAQQGPRTAPTVEDLLGEGDRHFGTGEIDKAIEDYGKAVSMAPKNAEAHYKLGVALGTNKQVKRAIAELEKAVALDPSNVRIERTLAGVYETAGMTEQAQDAYQRVMAMTKDPRIIAEAHKRFVLITAKSYAQGGHPDQALTILEELRRERGRDPEVLYYIGVSYMLANQLDKAEAEFKKIIQILPKNQNAYQDLVKIYEQKGDLDKAIVYEKKLLKFVPAGSREFGAESFRLAMLEGRRAVEKGDIDKALSEFQKALSIDPRQPLANYSAGLIYQQEGRWVDAEKSFNNVLEVMPGNLDARLHLAAVYIDTNRLAQGSKLLQQLAGQAPNTPQGRQAAALLEKIRATLSRQEAPGQSIDELIKKYEALAAQNPEDAGPHLDLGALYVRKRDLENARKQYEIAAKLDPTSENAHGTLAAIYDELGHYARAVDEYAVTVSLEKDPQRAAGIARDLLLALGKRFYNDHDLNESSKVFNEVLAQDPQNINALLYIGLIDSNKGELEDAETAYQQLLSISPNQLGARINLGLVYERLHREDDAIREYRYIIEQSPQSRAGDEARRRLKLVEKRIKGFFSSLDYRMVYDSNSTLSSQASEEYRTDASFDFSYRYKAGNDIQYTASWAPQYSTYHVGHFDFLTDNFTVSAAKIMARQTLSAGITTAIQNELLTGARVSSSNTVFLESSEAFRMPSIFDWNPDQPVDSSVRLDLYYSDLDTSANQFFSARTTSIGLTFQQNVAVRKALGLSYFYSRNRNKQPVGSDNAYNSHRLSINYQQGFTGASDIWKTIFGQADFIKNMVASINYSFIYFSYVNPDSFSNFTQRRQNMTNLLTAGLSYRLDQHLNLYFTYIFQQNESNLPVGFVFSAQQRGESQQNTPGTAIGVQSTSLGDFTRTAMIFGMTWNF